MFTSSHSAVFSHLHDRINTRRLITFASPFSGYLFTIKKLGNFPTINFPQIRAGYFIIKKIKGKGRPIYP
jgi:hypothetical protein